MHSKAVAATCDYMRVLVEGSMKEAQDRCAELNMEMEDFVRFVEFAYRGDYTAPAWELDMPEPVVVNHVSSHAASGDVLYEEPPPADEGFSDGWGVDFVPKSRKKKMKGKKASTSTPARNPFDEVSNNEAFTAPGINDKVTSFRTQHFDKLNFLPKGDPQADILSGFEPEHNTGPEQNFTPVFRAYVRLYVFSEMYLIHDLQSLTLDKLYHTLRLFTLFPKRVGDVIELARCAYERTPNRKLDGQVDKLRKLVVDYIVCEHAKVGKSHGFKQLLEEGGEFVSDFWDVMREHIL